MSAFEDSYKSQLQGVSQQIARERLEGQVTAQENMLSDPVTDLRRRPGASVAFALAVPGATDSSIRAWDTDLAGKQVHVILNTADGTIRVLDQNYSLQAALPSIPYLVTGDPSTIQAATVGDEFFLCNTANKPQVVPSTGPGGTGVANAARGFFTIKTGAFSTSYTISITEARSGGPVTKSYTYTTPDGTTAGDAAKANPSNIAYELALLIDADRIAGQHSTAPFRMNQTVYLETAQSGLAVTTSNGAAYMVCSGSGYIRSAADLPTSMPSVCVGYIVATGSLKAPEYYTYDQTSGAWLECGSALSPAGITNVPISVTYNGTAWSVVQTNFEGRLAGDDSTNPIPQLVTRGITGMSAYQGRLVLLAGSVVNMSASAKPRRFFRSTITSLLASDTIEVGASAASSAAYRHAIPFGKDLLLFSDKYQALVPGSASAITPSTATVVVTGTYDCDTTSPPVACGRSVMYAAPRSRDFFGLLEMLPSSTLENQYTSYDSTAHLPKYMAGRCRFGVSSSVANMVLFAPSNDRKALIVHEYTWQGDQKVQQAWHRWTFPYNVAAAYFAGQVVHVLFSNNGMLVACTIDARGGVSSASGEQYAKLDFSVFADVVGGTVTVPAWLTTFDPAILPSLRLAVATGPLAGETVGSTAVGGQLSTARSFQSGRVAMGLPYTSLVSPTPPMKKDSNGVKISSNKLTILRFMLGTHNSGEFNVTVSDTSADYSDTQATGPLSYSSHELDLGRPRVGGESINIIPARTNAETTGLVISTSGMRELNIVSLEYVAKSHDKIKRAWRQ